MHVREYDFPNARIRVYPDRTCREFPKWCAMISCERPRAYVAAALRDLRRFRRGEFKPEPPRKPRPDRRQRAKSRAWSRK